MTRDDRIPPLSHADSPDANDTIPWFDGALELDDGETKAPPPVPETPTVARQGSPLRDEGEIARGGMGSIRRLYDPELRRRVAMKVLEPSPDPNAARRFIEEARITGLLDHPNIVPIHDLIVEGQSAASYTMKLVEGETLTDLITRQKTVRDLEHILHCLIKVCEALSFAHGRGVIHRDLKPDNIMIGAHGQVYVMDWGCAQVIGDDRSIVDGRQDEDGLVIGTIAYMAPEQANGKIGQIDARTDVFGVGAMLYAALTGSPPYPGSMVDALPRAQKREVPPPDESSDSAIKPPPHLTQIAMKAMAADPKDRYQSTDELADQLREFLKGGNWFPLHKFPKGAVIVREGHPADAAYIITRGRCEVRKADASDPGRSVLLRTLGEGDVFGETAIFADAPRSASVIAVDDVSAVVVDRAAIERLTNTSWLGMFVKALANRFLDIDARLTESR
jgi:serine/threonine-protein kinase